MTDLATLARPHERVARLGLDVVCEEVCETGNEALLITALIGDVKWNGWEMPRIHRTEWECVASMQANATGIISIPSSESMWSLRKITYYWTQTTTNPWNGTP